VSPSPSPKKKKERKNAAAAAAVQRDDVRDGRVLFRRDAREISLSLSFFLKTKENQKRKRCSNNWKKTSKKNEFPRERKREKKNT